MRNRTDEVIVVVDIYVPACMIHSRYPFRSSSICFFSLSFWNSPRLRAFSLSLENSLPHTKSNKTYIECISTMPTTRVGAICSFLIYMYRINRQNELTGSFLTDIFIVYWIYTTSDSGKLDYRYDLPTKYTKHQVQHKERTDNNQAHKIYPRPLVSHCIIHLQTGEK